MKIVTDTDLSTAEALIRAASAFGAGTTYGPWQVQIKRGALRETCYGVSFHTHASITINPDGYYREDYQLEVDEDGYYQPDENADCGPHYIANAKHIAAANPTAIRLLLGEIDRLRALVDSPMSKDM